MARRKKLYIPINETTPLPLKVLVDGHNKGKWTVVPDTYDVKFIRKVFVRGGRSLLTYEISGTGAKVSLPNYKLLCVSTSEGGHPSSVLSLAMMIRFHEKMFLQKAVSRTQDGTLLGNLKYQYALSVVRHPVIVLAVLLWIITGWSYVFLHSREKISTEQTISSTLKAGSVVCEKIPGTNKVKC